MLKEYRKKLGLTQAEAAELIGISRKALSDCENNVNPLSLTAFIRAADLYGFDVFEVLGVRDLQDSDMEFDTDPYYLIKAHAHYSTASEKAVDERFGNNYPEEYYNLRFREKIKDMLNNPIYRIHFEALSAQEDVDSISFFD